MTIQEQRQAVIEEARTWIGTKFHHQACVKGAGVDCVQMPAYCYNKILGMDIVAKGYAAQWHLHGKKEKEEIVFKELYLEGLLAQGFTELSDGRTDFVPFNKDCFIDAKKEPGDFVVVKLARTYSHGGIIVDWPTIIQTEASPMGRGAVVVASVEANWYFTARPVRFFSPKVWHS